MRGRCIVKLSDFARENKTCCTGARDEHFSWILNSDTDLLLEQKQATDFSCSESDNAHLPSKTYEDSYWEVAEKEIMQFLCHLYKVKTEPSPLTSVEVGQYSWP